jgi:hypothetical protein
MKFLRTVLSITMFMCICFTQKSMAQMVGTPYIPMDTEMCNLTVTLGTPSPAPPFNLSNFSTAVPVTLSGSSAATASLALYRLDGANWTKLRDLPSGSTQFTIFLGDLNTQPSAQFRVTGTCSSGDTADSNIITISSNLSGDPGSCACKDVTKYTSAVFWNGLIDVNAIYFSSNNHSSGNIYLKSYMIYLLDASNNVLLKKTYTGTGNKDLRTITDCHGDAYGTGAGQGMTGQASVTIYNANYQTNWKYIVEYIEIDPNNGVGQCRTGVNILVRP